MNIEKASTLAWINKNRIVNEKERPMDWYNFYFLIDIYEDKSKKIAIRKSAQTGVSTFAIFKTIHDSIYHSYTNLHVFPSDNDVYKFVPAKVDQIINLNPTISKSQGKGEKAAVMQKQFGKGFIFYKGSNSATAAHMLTSDRNIYDEYDRADMKNLKDYESRQEGIDSKGEEWYISTPTVPGYGIDKKWEESDQKHLRFNCENPKCKHRQYLDWERNVDFEKKEYVCSKCGHKIDNTKFPERIEELDIRWEPKYPGRKISGYWINQMMLPWKTAAELIEDYKQKEKDGELDYFYNFKLGMPYLNSETEMPSGLVLKNIVGMEVLERNCVAGVDVQKGENFVTIGKDVKGELITIGLSRVKDTNEKTKWDRLSELIEVYDIRYMVIDGTYTPNEVIDFAKKHPGIVYVCWYQPDPKKAKIYRFGDDIKFTDKPKSEEELYKVLVDRERSLDRFVDFMSKGKIRFNFAPTDEQLQEMIRHMKTMYTRVIEGKDGKKRREWANTGKNDYVHSGNYMVAAWERQKMAEK